jgi:hypothetical protein
MELRCRGAEAPRGLEKAGSGMRMIKCAECGVDVSAKAEMCPHCGVTLREMLTYAGVVSRKPLASVDRLARRFLMIFTIIAVIALACYVVSKFI